MNLRCYGASRPKDEILCLALPSATKTKYEEEYELFREEKKGRTTWKWLNFPTTKGAFCMQDGGRVQLSGDRWDGIKYDSEQMLKCRCRCAHSWSNSELSVRFSTANPARRPPCPWDDECLCSPTHTWARHGASPPLDSQRRVPPHGPRFKASASSYCKDGADHRWSSVKQAW